MAPKVYANTRDPSSIIYSQYLLSSAMSPYPEMLPGPAC